MSIPLFQSAGVAEILRSAQKDAMIKQKLEEMLSNIILKALGTRKWLKYRSVITPLASFIYYSSTTLFCVQTLGEEYTGIVQVDNSLKHVPPFYRRFLMVLFDSFGYISILKLISHLENGPTILTLLQGIHRAVFYFQPTYYDFPKRLTNIKYILIRSWLKNQSHVSTFRIIGLIAFLTSILTSMKTAMDYMESLGSTEETSLISATSSSSEKCILCLEDFKNISVTPCGHLFCWFCIHACVQSKRECPVCREEVQPNRIVLLHNYTGQMW